jgi:AcrR family transcriptional regulator
MELSDRQKEILEVSFQIISDEGFTELSMKNIANKIGIKESSLYNHFENKKAILKSIFDYTDDKINSFIAKVSDSSDSGVDKVKCLFFDICQSVLNEPKLTKLVLRQFYHYDPYFKDEYINIMAKYNNFISEVIHSSLKDIINEKVVDEDFIKYIIKGCAREIAFNKLFIPDYDMEKDVNKFWGNIEHIILLCKL